MKILDVIDEETQGKVAISMGYVGLAATNTATNNMLLFMRGPDDGQLRVRLAEGQRHPPGRAARAAAQGAARAGRPLADGESWSRKGWSPEEAQARREQVSLRLRAGRHRQRGDELRLAHARRGGASAGPELADVRKHALKVLGEMKKIPTLRDVQLYQQLDYPTVRVDIDREKAGLSGVTVKDVTDALLVGTSSSRYVAKNYWRDPKSGVDYQVQVQVPTQRMDRPEQVETLPLQKVNPDTQPDGPRRGHGADRHRARADRPQLDAALPEHHRQRRGRGPGPGVAPSIARPSPTPASRRAACGSSSAARSRR